MEHAHQHRPENPLGAIAAPPFWRSRYGVGLIVFGAVATYFLLSEHRAHFLGALPFLFLLACPLMHVFMHRGHSGHDGHGSHAGEGGSKASPKPGDIKSGEQL